MLRFRPILMTTLAAALGALPLAIGFGEGAELRQPLGIAIIGGLDRQPVADAADDAGRLSRARPFPPPRPQRTAVRATWRAHRTSPDTSNASRMTRALITSLALLLAACNFAPDYRRPDIGAEIPGLLQGGAWLATGDAIATQYFAWHMDAVRRPAARRAGGQGAHCQPERRAAAAAYHSAVASVGGQRALLFPSVDLTTGASRTERFSNARIDSGRTIVNGGGRTASIEGAANSCTWATTGSHRSTSRSHRRLPDISGGVRDSVAQATHQAEASMADLGNATLAVQTELALDYVTYRGLQTQKTIYTDTIAAYAKALDITTNLYNAGSVSKADVLQAETSLRNALASAADVDNQIAALEHAIAVLSGDNPTSFDLPDSQWNTTVPEIPAVLPAALLERRPDIAAAERRMAAANAGIGIARSAYFPTLDFTADAATDIEKLSSVLSGKYSAWSLGVDGALTLLDFGARASQVEQSRATYEQTVAQYRQHGTHGVPANRGSTGGGSLPHHGCNGTRSGSDRCQPCRGHFAQSVSLRQDRVHRGDRDTDSRAVRAPRSRTVDGRSPDRGHRSDPRRSAAAGQTCHRTPRRRHARPDSANVRDEVRAVANTVRSPPAMARSLQGFQSTECSSR